MWSWLKHRLFSKRLAKTAFLLVLLLLPGYMLARQADSELGLVSLIFFGERFSGNRLEVVQDMVRGQPLSFYGYDGQFYAQLALDPTLSDGVLAAMDNPGYRVRRIGLPWLAFGMGLGHPVWVLHSYALLNLIFWFLLLWGLWRHIGLNSVRDALLFVVFLWGSGTLVSLERSLTDLPAVVLGLYALWNADRRGLWVGFMGFAALVKDTSLLSFGSWSGKAFSWKGGALATIAMLPLGLWMAYAYGVLPEGFDGGSKNFSMPFVGIGQKLWAGFQGDRGGSDWLEWVCAFSLLVQAVFLFLKPNLNNLIWRFGIGFALLLVFLGSSVWQEYVAYSRVLLPLSFSFNLLLHAMTSRGYWGWFIAGNIGLMSHAIQVLL